MADGALKRHPGDVTVAELLGRARDRRELKDLLESANRRLLMGDIDEAAEIVSSGRKRFPANAELKELAERIESGRLRHQELAAAQDALRRRQFEGARRIAERLIASDPDDVA